MLNGPATRPTPNVSTSANAPWTQIAVVGVRCTGCTVDSRAGSMPSRLMAKMIRTIPLLVFMVTAKMLEIPASPTSSFSHGA